MMRPLMSFAVATALFGGSIILGSPSYAGDLQTQLHTMLDTMRAEHAFPGATAAIDAPVKGFYVFADGVQLPAPSAR